MTILVTGAKGNIGVPLCKYLKSRGYTILRNDILQDYADDYILCDVTNPNELEAAFHKFKPDVVFHLAAIYGRLVNEKCENISVSTNIIGTNNIIQLCKRYGAKLIFFSTSEVYGNTGGVLTEERTDLKPNNRYGLLKLMCEQLIQYEVENYKLKAIILRPNMIYTETEPFGSYRSAMIRFTEFLLRGKKITVYKDSSRSWLYINDAVKIFEKCIYIKGFETINVAHPNLVKTTDFAQLLCDKLRLSYKDYVIEEDTPKRMTVNKDIDISKMIKLTGIKPEINIEQGIEIVLKNVRRRI